MLRHSRWIDPGHRSTSPSSVPDTSGRTSANPTRIRRLPERASPRPSQQSKCTIEGHELLSYRVKDLYITQYLNPDTSSRGPIPIAHIYPVVEIRSPREEQENGNRTQIAGLQARYHEICGYRSGGESGDLTVSSGTSAGASGDSSGCSTGDSPSVDEGCVYSITWIPEYIPIKTMRPSESTSIS